MPSTFAAAAFAAASSLSTTTTRWSADSRSTSARPIPDAPPVTIATDFTNEWAIHSGFQGVSGPTSRKDRIGDGGAVLRGVPLERVDPLCALVVAVQEVLPREADAAQHLDGALTREHRCLGGG